MVMRFRDPQLSGPLSRNVFVRALYRADRFADDVFDPEGNPLWVHECCLWTANEYETAARWTEDPSAETRCYQLAELYRGFARDIERSWDVRRSVTVRPAKAVQL